MSPIPGEPLNPDRRELTTKDGRKVRLKVPGLESPVRPQRTEERSGQEPPRNDPRPPVNPHHAGY
jgi:hypothetical protein